MNFLSPLSLIWFLPLGTAIVVLYLLKLKRKEKTVSSVMLWLDATADIQANAPFQKLKKSLLLLLQILALLLLVTALAKPFVRVKGITDNKIVVILDSSASMQCTDVSPSRFEDAKSKAIDIVNKMGPGDSMLVVTAGAKTRVVASFGSDKRSLIGSISGLKPVDTPCNMRQAMVLALSLVAGKSAAPPRIVILSDGGFGSLQDLSARNARIDFVRIGRECDNVAITGMDSRKTLSGDQQVFVGLQNFGKRERKFNMEVYAADQLLDIREQTLAPGQSKQEILGDIANIGGRVTAKLDIVDDLPADNTGSVYLAKQRKINALLVSKGNVFLQNALNLDPRTQLVKAEGIPSSIDKQKYDLMVFDGVAPPASLPPGGYLLINTAAAQGPADLSGSTARPTIVDWTRNHPISAYIDFSNVRISDAHYMKLKSWATPIIEGDGGVLAAAGSRDGRSFVQLSFSLLESDFPLRVGFPIFITNCLDWLIPSNGAGAGDSIRTGQPMYIDVPPQVSQITVTDPDGQSHALNVTQTPVIYDDTERAGTYKVRGKGINKEFACNLCSAEESGAVTRSAFMVGDTKFSATGKAVQTNREFYWPLILAVLGLLAFEWFAYHRRL